MGAGGGVGLGGVATGAVNAAAIVVAINGLIDPVRDVVSEVGNIFGGGGSAGRTGARVSGATPPGANAARGFEGEGVTAVTPPVVVQLQLNDKTLQEVDSRNEVLSRQGRAGRR